MGTLRTIREIEGYSVKRRTVVAAKTITDTTTIFTVTGDVWVSAWGVVDTVFTTNGGVPNLELGISGVSIVFIAATAVDKFNAIGDVWADTGAANPAEALSAAVDRGVIIAAGNDIIVTKTGSGTITGGALVFEAIWRPLSADGSLKAA